MTTPALTAIDNTADVIHSHDVIDRIAELERRKAAAEAPEGGPFDDEDASELCDLVDLELQCRARAAVAWRTGTELWRADLVLELADGGWFDVVDFAGAAYWLRVG